MLTGRKTDDAEVAAAVQSEQEQATLGDMAAAFQPWVDPVEAELGPALGFLSRHSKSYALLRRIRFELRTAGAASVQATWEEVKNRQQK